MSEPLKLSDWDVLALDERGQPTNAVTEPSLCGVRAEAYCNWVNVVDASLWREGSITPSPVVSTVMHGEISILDLTVVAERGPEHGVYFAAWFLYNGQPVGMAGLACWGWGEGQVYRGVPASAVAHLVKLINGWVNDKIVPPAFADLPWHSALRFNQGDAQAARRAGLPIAPTVVGEADGPQTTKE